MHLRWRHLHARHRDETEGMMLLWTLDQHRGQAKGLYYIITILLENDQEAGLGLHLQGLAQSLQEKFDLHQPTRTLVSLGPYDHLQRLVRVCYTHAKRNIQKCNVDDDVRNLMRSLLCVKHDDWDGTLDLIRQRGGKAGNGKEHVSTLATPRLLINSFRLDTGQTQQ